MAFLLEGRVGMVCDISMNKTAKMQSHTELESIPVSASGPSSRTRQLCMCLEQFPEQAPYEETGERSVYRNICTADDPPRSVAICPQRNCVAFGCAAGIELHWVDALTGHDLSRWFPLSSPSDYLYFLPARRGTDSAKKLRLIGSATALLHCIESGMLPIGHASEPSSSPSTDYDRQRGDLGAFLENNSASSDTAICIRPRAFGGTRSANWAAIRQLTARSVDHYRAVPLSDGHHILFTDPRTGYLCLGTDAPLGSVNRLLRKVWFRPPSSTMSSIPILYAAGLDTRHGVRVVATYASAAPSDFGEGGTSKQVVVFFTVPPDLLLSLSRTAIAPPKSGSRVAGGGAPLGHSEPTALPDYSSCEVAAGGTFSESHACPIEMAGQVVDVCTNLTDVALEASPDMAIWAFSSEGHAKTWAVDKGSNEQIIKTAVHENGSLHLINDKDANTAANARQESVLGAEEDRQVATPFDGTVGMNYVERRSRGEHSGRCTRARSGDKMSGTTSVDIVQGFDGIVRLDVVLR